MIWSRCLCIFEVLQRHLGVGDLIMEQRTDYEGYRTLFLSLKDYTYMHIYRIPDKPSSKGNVRKARTSIMMHNAPMVINTYP